MFYISKEFRFEASHQLKFHDGKCSRLHGHSWVGRVIVKGNELNKKGPKKNMLIDYSEIKSIVKMFNDKYLDHYHLNDTLATDSPTSEFIAKWLFNSLKQKLPNIVAIEIEETCTSRCRYEG